jgi:cysteine desulfurase/selenocysteine lyase
MAGFGSLVLAEGLATADTASKPAAQTAASTPVALTPQQIRRSLLVPPEVAYFNCGTLGPTPRPVLEKSFEAWQKMEEDPANEGFGTFLAQADQVRDKAAATLGCDKAEVALTSSTTEGMNAVASGIKWRAGDRVLITTGEHEGGSDCWEYFARLCGLELSCVRLPRGATDAEKVVKLFEAAMTPRTRVVSFSHPRDRIRPCACIS